MRNDAARPPLAPGVPGYRTTMVGAVAAGVVTFTALYCTQGILPALGHGFGVGADWTGWTVSALTLGIALFIIPVSAVSERVGRRPVILASVIGATALSVAAVFAPSFAVLLAIRLLQGALLSGVPATVVAYIADEFDPRHVAVASGMYVAGTGFGGLIGRLLPTFAAHLGDWRWGMGASAIIQVIALATCLACLPRQRRFRPERVTVSTTLQALGRHLRNPSLVRLYVMGFAIMGAYVAFYDLLAYRLQGPPHNLSEGQYSAVFLVNIAAMISSWYAGRVAGRFGRFTTVLAAIGLAAAGFALGATPWLPVIIIGSVILTFGVFAAHSIASGWVGPIADGRKADASALYMGAFYGGNALVSAIIVLVFERAGGVAAGGAVVVCAAVAAVVALGLRHAPDPGRTGGRDRCAPRAGSRRGRRPGGAAPSGS